MDSKTFYTGTCPACKSGRLKVLKTERPRRRIRCAVCGHTFSTVEIIVQSGENEGGSYIYTANGCIYTVPPVALILPTKV